MGKLQTVKLMPPGGAPKSVVVRGFYNAIEGGYGSRTVYASQHDPAIVPEDLALRLQKEHGWLPWEPRQTLSLEETQEQRDELYMTAPRDAAELAATATRYDENGQPLSEHLYPGVPGQAVLVDARDAQSLASQGWLRVYNDTVRPHPRDVAEGSLYSDPVTGRTQIARGGTWEPAGSEGE